ncbi:polysaccharide biosynthesis/export family protein [Capnocytophaga felis]|uniref:Polysaccharide biosynthesis protein n=1 Tax=Capnocytophaga felis TaxID=2267611 RepID=A0A5M4B8Q3_9FLAO|nr:polysaccharide biosynthesis/export family protein [Capnocytophaga felis]GET45662.1 polysaccharide biosynthesis protein [Capnocytophaga felis]GET47175.1 polysaccharide biosynthesis protein [Capnocytophaga felis]
MKRVLILFCASFLLFSCASRDKVAYFTNAKNNKVETLKSYVSRLQPDDLLSIIVNSKSDELLSEFNRGLVTLQPSLGARVSQSMLQTYLIDKDGYIHYPTIGKIKLGGLTRQEAVDLLTNAIKPYITDATINLRILNFKITVEGEVNRPGTYTIESERITLLQALSLAGDLTIYGKRKNILIIREQDNQRVYKTVDITSTDFMNSEYYYLNQNDIVYVEPNKTRVNSSVVGPNTTTIISSISVLVAVVALIVNISR